MYLNVGGMLYSRHIHLSGVLTKGKHKASSPAMRLLVSSYQALALLYLAVVLAVGEIDDKTDNQPDDEPDPVPDTKLVHHVAVEQAWCLELGQIGRAHV